MTPWHGAAMPGIYRDAFDPYLWEVWQELLSIPDWYDQLSYEWHPTPLHRPADITRGCRGFGTFRIAARKICFVGYRVSRIDPDRPWGHGNIQWTKPAP